MTKKSPKQKTDANRDRVARWRAKIKSWLKSRGYKSAEAFLTASMKADEAARRKG